MANCCKRLLLRHSKIVDFTGASCIICICIVVLLPKVHESFQGPAEAAHQHEQATSGLTQAGQHASGPPEEAIATTSQPVPIEPANSDAGQLVDTTNDPAIPNQDNHHHHHNHKLPIGEVLICAGFIVFYCIGLGLSGLDDRRKAMALIGERRISTVCCSSTRCPSGQREAAGAAANSVTDPLVKSHEEMLEGAHLLNDRNPDDDCVMLLNRHHNHHTHSRHHEHQQQPQPAKKRPGYGSLAPNMTAPDSILNESNLKASSAIYVEEIIITSDATEEELEALGWPIASKVTVFGILLAAALILFDMNIYGMMESIKVFRAAATGALLYVAFFIVMPKHTAGCGSCKKEEL